MVDGGATTTAALKTAAGAAIAPTRMSVNTKSGFSIIKAYTTNVQANDMTESVPHGLTQTPDFILSKPLTSTHPWQVYHKNGYSGNPPNNLQGLNFTTADPFENSGYKTWEVTNSLIKFGRQIIENNNDASGNPNEIIFYAWHSVPGYSAFGYYEGNASTDGPFIYTGFKPAWLMIKNITTDSDYTSWGIYDNSRNPNNQMSNLLWANKTATEGYRGDGTNTNNLVGPLDFLSNGFKVRSTACDEFNNDGGKKFIYMAFAEQPTNFTTAR